MPFSRAVHADVAPDGAKKGAPKGILIWLGCCHAGLGLDVLSSPHGVVLSVHLPVCFKFLFGATRVRPSHVAELCCALIVVISMLVIF